MAETLPNSDNLEADDLRAAAAGDAASWKRLVDRYRDRLRRQVAYRLDDRIQSRVDASDVVQEALLDASKRLDEYLAKKEVPFLIWLRALVQQRLGMAHRDHLGRAKRSAAREVQTETFDSSQVLAVALLDRQPSPSEHLLSQDISETLKKLLDELEPLDREVLMLRHFEQLENAEAAVVLGITPAAASQRYGRALRRLRDILHELGTLQTGPYP